MSTNPSVVIVKLQAPASNPSLKALSASSYLLRLRFVVFRFLLVACGLWLELNFYPPFM
jgi:hypothetical protein